MRGTRMVGDPHQHYVHMVLFYMPQNVLKLLCQYSPLTPPTPTFANNNTTFDISWWAACLREYEYKKNVHQKWA